jgi:hypothetical protein
MVPAGGASLSEQEPTERRETVMSNVTSKNRIQRTAADQALMDGINKHPTTIPVIYVGGAAVPATTVVAALQARVDTGKTVVSTRATWRAAVGAERDELAKSASIVAACRQALLLAFAGQVDTLAEFGLTPRKPRVVTPGTQVVAAQKAKATREARHTMGTKQKAKVKGDVTGITVTPITATPPNASPPPAPNGNAPTATTGNAPTGTTPTGTTGTPPAGGTTTHA